MRNEWLKLRNELLFKTKPADFQARFKSVMGAFEDEYKRSNTARQNEIVDITAELLIDMQSYLANWNIQKVGDPSAVKDEVISALAESAYQTLINGGYSSKVDYVKKEVAKIKNSNLVKLSKLADKGAITNRWGNDYATGLTAALRKGATLVTTNPVLIDAARKEDPATWDKVKADLKVKFPGAAPEKLATEMTMQVVLQNCREMRPIYEISNGAFGYVSLQVNPKNSSDAEGMVKEAEYLYKQLEKELGGVPNVVFKVPATKASLDAVKKLTAQGIGVNVTVNFAVDQEVAFGEAIEQGNAKVSFLTIMSGRLDDPIRDELKELGVEGAADAAKWAGIAVSRRVYDILYRQRGYKKSVLLQASLRGPWHIDGLITDEKTSVCITVFPDKAEEYDSMERDLKPRLAEEIPADMMSKLNQSKLFKQAYEVNALTPNGFDTYYPVQITLASFGKVYDEFLAYLAKD